MQGKFTEDPISDSVINRVIARSAQGMKSYNTSLYANDTKTPIGWIEDAIEEALDMAVYLEKVRLELLKRLHNA